MFSRILIANRGEIACRIIQTAQQLGIHCVAVYSSADINARHVKMADEAYLLGPAQSSDSYLRGDKIIQIAASCGAQAIHPGYGFLSENAQFASACEQQNIVFIGPPAAAIAAMGSKSAAKEIMSNAEVPLVPGYHGDCQDLALLKKEALKCGFPLLLKAVAGGGGKGMRIVECLDEFEAALAAAQREAQNAFGNSDMLIERYLTKTRHIEVQVFCDSFGAAIYLSQRDCSIQRRHQKIVEEAPAPGISQAVVAAMGEAALNAARAINYVGAGTVEFLYNEDGSFYFMEMNTRLQVEHPVTEMITNVDLVRWQLQIASGEALPLTQRQVTITGHAIECRIYAEDPEHNFLPATGTLEYLHMPRATQQVRIDTGVERGDEVSVYYDPMLAKLIVWGEDRPQAIARMQQALLDYRMVGVKNNLPFLYQVISCPAFSDAIPDTQFIDNNRATLFNEAPPSTELLAIASCCKILFESAALSDQRLSCPFASGVAWRMNQLPSRQIIWQNPVLSAEDDDLPSEIITQVEELPGDASALGGDSHRRHFRVEINRQIFSIQASLSGDKLDVWVQERKRILYTYNTDSQLTLFDAGCVLQLKQPSLITGIDDDHGQGALNAPMNGRVIALLVTQGQKVTAGTVLMIIEAMKMEHSILAPSDGEITDIYFAESDLVTEGDTLIAISDTENLSAKV